MTNLNQRKPKVFWWHPQLMDYRRPLFDRALAAWDIEFFVLNDPGAQLARMATVTVAAEAAPVAMRPWALPWSEVRALWRGVRRSDAVVTSFMWNGYTLYLILFAMLQRKPIAVWEEWSRFFPTLLGRIQWAYYRLMHRCVDGFFTLGGPQEQALLSIGVPRQKIHRANEYPGLCYAQVPPCPLPLPGEHAACRILFLGRLIAVKGVPVLLRAFSVLALERADLQLLIVGEGEERARLEQLGAELGLLDRVTFLGSIVDPAQKSYLLRECAVMAVPSITLNRQTEGGPLVVLEALSAGLPVVSSNAVGSSEAFVAAQASELVVNEGSVTELANALRLVLQDPVGFRQRAQRCFEQIPGHGVQFEKLNASLFGDESA